MVTRTKSMLLACGLSIAALFVMPLIPEAVSQDSQQSATPLKDVCREGWSRYSCGYRIRLCISPDLEKQYDLTTSIRWSVEGCYRDQTLIPDVWAHVPSEVLGYLRQAWRWRGYRFRSRIVNFDSSMVKAVEAEATRLDPALDIAIRNLQIYRAGDDTPNHSPGFAEEQGFNEFKGPYDATVPEKSLEQYKLEPPIPKAGATDVCPAAWSRFSCRFVRLCVSPSVTGQYNLATSKEFGYADCKADNRTVPDKDTYCSPKQDTHCSPHDVGWAAGALILGPRYLRAVKLDSSDIFDGNIEEAIQRLVLVPIPTSGLMEYDRGYEEGQAAFQKYLTENGQKDTESPH